MNANAVLADGGEQDDNDRENDQAMIELSEMAGRQNHRISQVQPS